MRRARRLLLIAPLVSCANANGPSSSAASPAPASTDSARAAFDSPSHLSPDPRGPGDYYRGGGGASVPVDPAPIEAVLRTHVAELRQRCWLAVDAGGATTASETVHLTIDGRGLVTNAAADGDNDVVGVCLAREMRGWAFPARGSATAQVDVPIRFVDDAKLLRNADGGATEPYRVLKDPNLNDQKLRPY